jgi:tRNA threonylcarbamoyladenosine biosynthesis protein TsaE
VSSICSIEVNDLAGTEEFGRRLGRLLFPGAVIGLAGPLGAGKTHLVRAIAEGLGVEDSRAVNSPTFVLIQEYDARLPIYHFDAYRLPSPQAFLDLGAEEYLQGEGVCLVEWADKVKDCLPVEHLWIELVVTGPESRRFVLTGQGEAYRTLLDNLSVQAPGFGVSHPGAWKSSL